MKSEKIQCYGEEAFRRLSGVKKSTFNKMVSILKEAECKKKVAGEKPNALSMENRLLMALESIKEYRTYFHVDHLMEYLRALVIEILSG